MRELKAKEIIEYSIIIFQCEFSIYIIARIDSNGAKNTKIIQN